MQDENTYNLDTLYKEKSPYSNIDTNTSTNTNITD